MAGSFKNPERKKWTLFRGYRGLFQRVDTDGMDEDSPDTQFNLATQLLNECCESDAEEKENAREGVYWLIKASEQGHVEATECLKRCLIERRGVTEQNISRVTHCLNMTINEKLSIKAMKHLMNDFSEGEEFITSNQLLDQLENAACIKKDEVPVIKAGNEEDIPPRESDKLTEDVLVSYAKHYCEGFLPPLTLERRESASAYKLYGFVSTLEMDDVLRVGCRGISYAVKLLLTALVFRAISVYNFSDILSAGIYYVSFVVMVVSTCQALHHRKRFASYRAWSNLFLTYGGGSFSRDEAELRYCQKGGTAFAWFFAALATNLWIMSGLTSDSQYRFGSEATFAAFLFTAITLCAFTLSKPKYLVYGDTSADYVGLVSFMLYILAKYPYETDSVVSMGWRFLDLTFPTFPSYVVGNGVEFCLNFRVIFYLGIPVLMLKMSARNGWRGFYTDLIPHCVTLSWWQLALIYAKGATWYGLIRIALAVVGIVCFFPLVALASVILPVFAAVEYALANNDGEAWITTAWVATAIATPLLYKIWNKKPAGKSESNYVVLFRIAIATIAAVYLLWNGSVRVISLSRESREEFVSPDEFAAYCDVYSSNGQGEVAAEAICSQLIGIPVTWTGRIVEVEIADIRNPLNDYANYLPLPVSKYVRCFFGEKYPLCRDSFKLPFCNVLNTMCQLSNWNSYEIMVRAEVPTTNGETLKTTLKVTGGTDLLNFTQGLREEDEIRFFGTVSATRLRVMETTVRAWRLECVRCDYFENAAESVFWPETTSWMPRYRNFFKCAFNFILNPVVIIT